MRQVNWGIIGCGDVTEVKSGPAFNKVSNSNLVAVMRRDEQKAQDYATRHLVPKWYGNANQLINDTEINAIYIATPPSSHEVLTIEALKAGKPVYVEKPMSLNQASCKRMYDAAKFFNTKLTIAHYRRAQPVFKSIKSLLANNEIGDIRFVNVQLLQSAHSNIIAKTDHNWRVDPALSGGGFFHDLAPHHLDLLIYFFGYPDKQNGSSFNQAKLYPADDIVSGELIFKKNIIFKGLWCFNVPNEETKDSCEIIGSEGKISFSFHGNSYILTKNGQTKLIEFDRLEHVQQPMIAEVVKYFLGETANPCNAKDAIEVMKVMDTFTSK